MKNKILNTLSAIAIALSVGGCSTMDIERQTKVGLVSAKKDLTREMVRESRQRFVGQALTPTASQGTENLRDAKSVVVYGLRKFPYPYKAMLAISSDADHETLRKFNLLHEFLNTNAMTPMGRGLGLDISDSFFMYNGSNLPQPIDYGHVSIKKELTYFKGTSNARYGADIIDAYIHDGWIDTIHTYGDFSRVNQRETLFRRDLAVQAIQALEAANDHLIVWTDHGNKSNVDNFGSYGTQRFYNYQQGANPKSPYYHTDITIPYGIKFVWTDVASHIFGHSTMLYPIRLPDGQKIWGFWRYTDTAETRTGVVHWAWSADNLAQQLSYANLARLEWHHQYAILAQHLCSNNYLLPLPKNAISALKFLAKEYHKGNILVARTSRLLTYNVTQVYLKYRVTYAPGHAVIHIISIHDPVLGTHVPSMDELRGITFYTSDPAKTEIELGNKPISPALISRNPSDGISPSIGIKWFPPDTKNYAMTAPGVF
jgi:hypothetical protein